ncbi:MAG: nucleotidyl transferase AbiEii/AbiGii toxin family protein [Candidatus Dojkabacteria bacterium]
MYSDRDLGLHLGFKGGTCAYLFYDLPRFSVDLDFNLLDITQSERLYKSLESIVSKYGQIRDQQMKEHAIYYELSYAEEGRNIKLEVNLRDYGDKYQLKDYYGQKYKIIEKEYMFAHKLVALTDRRRVVSRDLFDINFFLKKHWDIAEEIVESRTGKSIGEYIDFLIDYIEKNFSENNVLDGLGELIDEEQKKSIKKQLISDTVFNLKLYKKLGEKYGYN